LKQSASPTTLLVIARSKEKQIKQTIKRHQSTLPLLYGILQYTFIYIILKEIRAASNALSKDVVVTYINIITITIVIGTTICT
jgi:hypothetical protein